MRILSPEVFVFSFLLLALMVIILIVNISLMVRRRQSLFLHFFNIASLFGEAFLFCIFMCNAIIDMESEIAYLKTAKAMLVVFLMILAVGAVICLFNRKKLMANFRLSPDLETVFSTIKSPVFIAQAGGEIANANKAAKEFVGDEPEALSMLIKAFEDKTDSENYPKINKALSDIFHDSINEVIVGGRYYQLIVSPISAGKSQHIGANIIFHDIHEKKLLTQKIDAQNVELLTANKMLFEDIKIADALKEEKERLRLLREIQNSLVFKIEGVINDISEFNNLSGEKSLHDYNRCIFLAKTKLREVFSEVRSSVNRLSVKGRTIDQTIVSNDFQEVK